ncbi:hypothetical protein [Methylobacterium sp. WL69]|uniref:hypothetical protein n=1 Tax=Methylobacterium sp. WL69 TaxID=2603893 RepID=UPI001AED7695
MTVALDTQAGANAEIRSTRLLFLIVGFGVAAWAPLVPFVAARAGLDAATPGGLLLCLGIGSLAAMRPRLRHRPDHGLPGDRAPVGGRRRGRAPDRRQNGLTGKNRR